MKRLVGLVAVLVALVAVAGSARADDDPDTEVARRLFRQGSALYLKGDYEPALALFEKAKLAKPLPAFEFNIARCHDRLGRWAEALAAYERYVATATDTVDVQEAQERIVVLQQRVKGAADRATAEEHYHLAVTAYNAGRFADAAGEFRRAEAAGGDKGLLYNVAQAYRLAGNAKAAVEAYQAFLQAVPSTPMRATVESRIAELSPRGGAAPAKPVAPTFPDAGGASDRLKPVVDVIKAHRAGFRACFDQWGAKHPGLGGKVNLTFYLDPDGMLGDGKAETVGFSAPEVSSCMLDRARELKYPPSGNGRYTRITYPFDFKPQ